MWSNGNFLALLVRIEVLYRAIWQHLVKLKVQISLLDGHLEKSIHIPKSFQRNPIFNREKWKGYKCPPSKERINEHRPSGILYNSENELELHVATWRRLRKCSMKMVFQNDTRTDYHLYIIFLTFYFVLGYSQWTMLWQVQVNSKGTQPYVYKLPPCLQHLSCHVTLIRVLCAI